MKIPIKFTITVLAIILIASVISYTEFYIGYSQGQTNGLITGVNYGYNKGQNDTLANIQGILKSGGIVLTYNQQANGNYLIQVLRVDGNTLMTEVALISAETFDVLNVTGLIGDNHVPPRISVNVDWTFQIADGAGVRDVTGSSGNLITDIGNAFVCNLTVGRSMTGFTYGTNGTVYIALGNGTSLTYSDTKLTSEIDSSDTGFKRANASATVTYASGTGIGAGNYANFTLQNKFTATAIDQINATSLHFSGGAGSDNNMVSEASIGVLPAGQLCNPNDNVTISWTWTIQK